MSVDETRCPVCGDANGCSMAAGGGTCWCFQQKVNAELIDWLQMQGMSDQCLCPACAGGMVRSPCVDVCELNPASDICRGCYRSLDEIADWSRLGPDARADVYLSIRDRKERAGQGT